MIENSLSEFSLSEYLFNHANEFSLSHKVGEEMITQQASIVRSEAVKLAVYFKNLGYSEQSAIAFCLPHEPIQVLVDLACCYGGYIQVPLHPNCDKTSFEYIINHSEAKILIIDELFYQNHQPFLKQQKDLRIILKSELLDLINSIKKNDPEIASIPPNSTHSIMYTSGTTGEPKGVVLTHQNILSNVLGIMESIPHIQTQQKALSYLPLTHIFAKTTQYFYLVKGVHINYTEPDHLLNDLCQVQPEIMISVPRPLEKITNMLLQHIASTSPKDYQTLIEWIDCKEDQTFDIDQLPVIASLQNQFELLHKSLGNHIKLIITGGAAIAKRIIRLFAAAGISVLEGYGLTESSPVLTINPSNHFKPGAVGKSLHNIELKIAKDGEILAKGPNIMKEYFKNAKETQNTLSNGWLHTGDIGEIDSDGFLRITDRKKNIFKLSTGKYVTPQPIQQELSKLPFIDQSLVLGEGFPFCTALLFPDPLYFEKNNLSYLLKENLAQEDTIQLGELNQHIQTHLDAINQTLPDWSQVKRFVLSNITLSIENGLLTPTQKIKQRVVKEKLSQCIQLLYNNHN